MSPAAWHLLILWIQLVYSPRMSAADYPYVSKFEYVPRLHPSRNPECTSRFPENNRRRRNNFNAWNQPSIEIRAVLIPCSESLEEKTFNTFGGRYSNRWDRSYEEEKARRMTENCSRKIYISMKFTNIGKTDMQEKFVVIDHVLDPATMRKIPLRSPYVIKVRQEAVLQLYGLKFQSRVITRFIGCLWRYQQSNQNPAGKLIDRAILNKVVNAEAREEVINNDSPNYMGCNIDSESPTCGQTFLHGEPVRYSQGFCCSCDPDGNARRHFGGSNDSFESFHAGAKSNYNGGTNKPRNRLRTETEYTSLDDNRMAERQSWGNEARSKKKKPNANANPDRSRIIGSGTSVSDSCQERDTGNKPIEKISSKKSRGNKETEKLSECLVSRTTEDSSSPVTNSFFREKYSRKLADTLSTSVSPVSPKVTAGRPPSGDKIVSSVDVVRDGASARKNDVPQKETGRIGDYIERQNREKDVGKRKDRSRQEQRVDLNRAESENLNFRMETSNAIKGNQKSHSVVSRTETEKSLKTGETRSKDSSVIKKTEERVNQSPSVIRSGDPLSPTKYVSIKKSATGKRPEKAASWSDAKETGRKGCGKCRQLESFHGNGDPPAKSTKKRNKVFPAASAIDSPAIRPAMHLNEPLKNLSTGVLNSNRSPPARKASRRGNLNRVMESTSPLSDIIAKSFNDKHEADGYPRSKGNERNEVLAGAVERDKLFSKTLASEEDVFLKNDSFKREKKLVTKEIIKNYTPQKRTLKDLSSNDHDLRNTRNLRKHHARNHQRKTSLRRSRRHLRSRKDVRHRHRRSKPFDGKVSRRSRRKRARKTDVDKATVSGTQNSGRGVRVYIDDSKLVKGRANGESRSGKLAHGSANNETPEMAGRKGQEADQSRGDSISRNEANRQDSVDKQIEEKFSRISDALKEDAMGPKVISTKTEQETADNDRADQIQRASLDGANSQDKFNELNDVSSGGQNNETPGEMEEATDMAVDEKVAGFNKKVSSDPSIKYNELDANEDVYLGPQKSKEAGEHLFASLENSPSASNSDDLADNSLSSTNFDLVISPTMGPSINEQIQVPASSVAGEEIEKTKLSDWNSDDGALMNVSQWTTAEATSAGTQALIVIDVFKVANGSIEQVPLATTPKVYSSQSKLMEEKESSKKAVDKSFRQSFEFRPVHRTLQTVETTTLLVTESTMTTERPPTVNATTETTSGQTTMITDETFRPSIKPPEGVASTSAGGAEFHKEIGIDEPTFPDETDAPSTVDGATVPRQIFVGLESVSGNKEGKKKLRLGFPGRKRKRTTPSMIRNKDSLVDHGPVARRDDRSLYSGDPRHYGRRKDPTRPDNAMKFSLEAGNVDLVKQQMGVTRSYFREQRKYVELRVDGHDKLQGSKDAKFPAENYGSRKGYQRNEVEIGNRHQEDSKDVARLIHPWFPTTEAAEYTVRPKYNFNRVSFGKGKSRSPNQSAEDIPGRILPPCTRNRGRRVEDYGAENGCEANVNQRRRRLLSVQNFKGIKSVAGHRSSKDRKKIEDDEGNFIKDQDDDREYEENSAEHRKRLKSVHDKDHEKSKKRDATRSALKRKKEEKNRSKKHSISSSEDSSEDYDYLLPEEQEYDEDRMSPEEKQADVPNNSEEFLENYEGVSDLEDTPEKGTDGGSKIAEELQDDNSYNQLIADTDSVGFDKFAENLRAESQAAAIGEERPGNVDVPNEKDQGVGKDFEISLTGKIHLESDSNGRPVSISFNAAPEFFREDSIADGKANYANRFPSESANSFIDASNTLVGTDNANFLPLDVFDVQQSLDAPLDSIDDRSNIKEYYPVPIRARTRSAELYRDEGPENHRQRLLHLRKKSVDKSGDLTKRDTKSLKDDSKVNGKCCGSTGNPECLKKNSETSNLGQEANFVPEETKGDDELPEIDQGESSNIEDQHRAPVYSSEDGLKKTATESLTDSSQSSMDLLNMPENSFAKKEVGDSKILLEEVSPLADSDSDSNNASNITMQKVDLPETSTTGEKLGDQGNTTIGICQNPDVTPYSNNSETMGEQFDKTITTIRYETSTEIADELTAQYPKFEEAIQSPNASEYGTLGNENKESIEKKNMLAMAEFVKKLETLVTDAGNSSNKTGHTLIHLKKFIIVPDNRTLWSVKEFAEPETGQQTTSAEEIIVMGEGAAGDKGSKKLLEDSEDAEQPANEVDQKVKLDDSNLIKEIISSVIRGDNLKRDVASKKSDELDDQTIDVKAFSDIQDRGCKDWTGNQGHDTHLEVGGDSGNSVKKQEEIAAKGDGSLQNSEKNPSDRLLKTNPETAKELSRNDNIVCAENKSNVKEKREASPGNVNSVNHKGENKSHDKKKNVRYAKKKRRKKRKRKMKKKKGKRNEKSNKKTRSKWPFKRNLLMILEKEQIEMTGGNFGTQRKTSDGFSSYKENKRKIRFSRDFKRGNKLKEPQIRGGQDCGDNRHPSNVDPLKYMESAHCLRFSDLWYSVYQLEKPVIDHKIHIEIYQKHSPIDGSISWKDLTNGSAVRLGTFDRHHRNKDDTMTLAYSDIKLFPNTELNLDPEKDRLLMPSTLTGERSVYPEIKGWSGEYLVVQADKINGDANECDKAGVGFTAFVGQPDRCERVRGTCLKNQPLAYWRHDMEARESGRAGCYFLSNFAWVPSEAIKYNVNGTGSREFLALEYHSPHVSVIDVELRADYNAFLGAGSPGRLTEVHADNTAIDYTVITVLITNRGSSSSSYRARITDCPKGLPAAWLNVESPTTIIPPHRDRKITLDIYGSLSLDKFSCSVELLNRDGEPLATRQIKVRKMDRCFCVRHCACSCVDNARGISCRPMLLENYRAAGFEGSIPVTPVESPVWSDIVTIVLLFFTALLFFLLFLGFLKWLIGLCVPAVGRAGLDVLFDTNQMSEYYEKDLKSRTIVFDQFGAPVHPDTDKKTVRICNRKLEFFLNVIFFFLYPFAICHSFGSRSKQPSTIRPSTPSESKTSLTTEKEESPTMVRLSTYGDTVNSKMEAEDTRYVIDELKKSQESLQNQDKYKRNRQIVKEHSSSD